MDLSDMFDVVVVGAGPAGSTVAAEAARAGASVFVAEKRTGDSPSRAGVIQPRVLEQLALRGMMGRFREAAAEWRPDFEVPLYMYAGQLGLRYHEMDSDFPYALILPQTTTEHLLRAWAQEQGAELRRGVTYVGHREEADGVSVDFEDQNGETITVGGRHLVGADGARSQVRTAAGIPFEGRETTLTALSVDADLDFPWPVGMKMFKNGAGWILSYPFGKNTTRFIIVAEAARHTPLSVAVTLDEVTEHLRAIAGTDFEIRSAKRMSRYGDDHKTVPLLTRGAVSLVGEATRVHYPASGIGMNYCIQDAFNLGWKLGAVATGRATEDLLISYHEERYPVLQKLMADVDTQTSLNFNFSEAGRQLQKFFEEELVPIPEVNRILRDRLSGFGTSYHREEDAHPAIGERVSRLTLDDGRSYAELAATADFVLIERQAPDSARSLPDRTAYGTVRDLPASTTARGAEALLVRPDGYIGHAWADAPADREIREAHDRSLRRAKAPTATAGAGV
ncbi:FAD-dependent monooxygenase [Leucobacter weissii]|uniref:FAD-dependent monooxygenase n=1 Tax=Leucobacter weissii TaxID=1983706 RepID=A0A939MRN8_9MICO|nr:FAD-dependent oxidoreductase [Leucobacter weissii]MBO1901759.1 FAD-dependent monooxygenase [Leucobacter weissii]